MNRIKLKLEEEVSLAQAGFRAGKGTRDHILSLNILIQKCRNFNSELRVCFIDYSKAFDCVSHQQLWKALADMNFNPTIGSLIRHLYEDQEATVRVDNGFSDWFPVKKGVRQGCILSPYLFSIYTEDIMRDVQADDRSELFEEPKVNGHLMRDLRYADDTALLSKTEAGLGNLIMSIVK